MMTEQAKKVIVDKLANGSVAGKSLRMELIRILNLSMSPFVFYLAMSKLEDQGVVVGFWANKMVAGQLIKERRYRLPQEQS